MVARLNLWLTFLMICTCCIFMIWFCIDDSFSLALQCYREQVSLSSCFRFCPIITHESVWTTLNLTLYYIATSPYLIFTFYIKIPQWYFQSSYRKWRLEIEKLENWTSTQYLPSVVLYNHVQIYNSFTSTCIILLMSDCIRQKLHAGN